MELDWDQIPADFNGEVLIDVRSTEGAFEQVHLPVRGWVVDEGFKKGFVESRGYVSVPASAASLGIATSQYLHLPFVGREAAGSVMLHAHCFDLETNSQPWLSYDLFTFTQVPAAKLQLYFVTTLDLDPEDPMMYDVQIDEGEVQTHRLLRRLEPDSGVKYKIADSAEVEGWFEAAQDGVWKRFHCWKEQTLKAGPHSVRIRLRHSNIVLEKLVLDLEGVEDCYLGPPPNYQIS